MMPLFPAATMMRRGIDSVVVTPADGGFDESSSFVNLQAAGLLKFVSVNVWKTKNVVIQVRTERET